MNVKKRLVETILVPMIRMGGTQYLEGVRFPSMTAGRSKYVPGNCPEGLSEEEIAKNKEIDEKRKKKRGK